MYSHRMKYTSSQVHSPKAQVCQGRTFSCLKASLHVEPPAVIQEPGRLIRAPGPANLGERTYPYQQAQGGLKMQQPALKSV